MKTKKILVLTFSTLLLAIISCKNDESTLSVKDKLIANSWKLQSSKTNEVSDVIQDCQKDNILTFLSNGTYKLDSGEIKCDSVMDESESGPWTLSEDEKYIIVDEDWEITIIELTNSKLVILEVVGKNKYETTLVAI